MDLKLPRFDSGALSGLKDRLGLHENRKTHQDSYEDDYDADYGEYGYDGYEEQYEEYAEQPESESESEPVSRQRGAYTVPALITAEDIRANTHYTPPPAEEELKPLPTRETVTYQTRYPGNPASRKYDLETMEVDEQRSAGLQSLFTPTTEGAEKKGETPVEEVPSTGRETSTPNNRYVSKDPVVTSRHARIMTVISPQTYNDAERVARTVRTGDVAVLSLRSTPDDVMKRILDFSFGVACALDARVDCVSSLVFVITRGSGLSEDEEARLRGQGLM